MNYDFAFRALYPYLESLPSAIFLTLSLSFSAILLSMGIGIGIAQLRMSSNPITRLLGRLYIEALRNTPLLIVLFLVFFSGPAWGIRLSPFQAAVIALTLNSSAYMAEIFRAGLLAIPRGQFEACDAQGMTRLQTLRHVIFPQIFRIIQAPFGNQVITVVLASSLASAIGVEEVSGWMQNAGSSSFRYFETFLAAAVVYVFLAQGINLIRIVLASSYLRRGPRPDSFRCSLGLPVLHFGYLGLPSSWEP